MTSRKSAKSYARITAHTFCALLIAFGLSACIVHPQENKKTSLASMPVSDVSQEAANAGSNAFQTVAPITYPTGWLVTQMGDIPPGTALRVLHTPDIDIVGHSDGLPISEKEQDRQRLSWPNADSGNALVEYEGRIEAVPTDRLMVNLPDLMPDAEYDIVYSYASTTRCAGRSIPGVTDKRLSGYSDGRQDNPYLAKTQFLVPCAYRTALKAQMVNDALESQGMRLLVYDAYRPMTAQLYLSDAFEAALWNDGVIRESLGDWSLDWYVANSASGHNYGTDLDVGICDLQGNPIAMPSSFDAFDESGHLTQWPMAAGNITPDVYCNAVLSNEACMTLHAVFRQAGFSELASEWWHFADDETEMAMREIIGDGGLDFIA